MATSRTIANFAELVEVLQAGPLMIKEIDPGSVTIEPYSFDERINWATYIVKIKGQPVGFTNGPIQ